MSPLIWFQIIVGIFSVIAFVVVSVLLFKNQLQIGPWILLGFATLCLMVAEYMKAVAGQEKWHMYLVTVAMIMIFLVAVLKFWDIMELMQGYQK